MILATFYFHNPTAVPPEKMQEQIIQMSKNNALTGALLFIIAMGAGPWSLDARRARTKA